MNLERDDAIRPHRLEHAGDVTRRDRIVRLGAPILSRITEIWHDGRDTGGAGVLERPDEKQEPAELVVGRFRRTAVEALDDVDIGAVDRVERTHLVLAVLEFPLFMRSELAAERLRDCLAEVGCCLQREQSKSRARDQLSMERPVSSGLHSLVIDSSLHGNPAGNVRQPSRLGHVLGKLGKPNSRARIRRSSPIATRRKRAEAVGVKRGKGLHHWRGRDLADGAGEDAVDPDGIESLACCEHRAVDIDATAGIFDHQDIEALALGVLGRIADAKVEREPRKKQRA